MTPHQLFDWASTSIPAVYFDYCTNEEYLREEHFLEERFQASRTIPGTRKFHSFIPTSSTTVQVRPFSASTTFKEERVTSLETDVPLESLSGFVACVREGYWWLACVLDIPIQCVSPFSILMGLQTHLSTLKLRTLESYQHVEERKQPCI